MERYGTPHRRRAGRAARRATTSEPNGSATSKFGLFIHWGIYAVPAGEWKDRKDHAEWIMLTGNIPSAEYEKFATRIQPGEVQRHRSGSSSPKTPA